MHYIIRNHDKEKFPSRILIIMGLPCPNPGTGGHNFHGRYEYICIQSMEKTVEPLLKIVEYYAQGSKKLN